MINAEGIYSVVSNQEEFRLIVSSHLDIPVMVLPGKGIPIYQSSLIEVNKLLESGTWINLKRVCSFSNIQLKIV